MIEAAYPKQPSERELALVRRFMTHANAEQMLAGLLTAFFGDEAEDVDKVAASRRRRGKQHPDEHSETNGRPEEREAAPKENEDQGPTAT